MSPCRRALHSIGEATLKRRWEDRERHWGTKEGSWSSPHLAAVLKHRDLGALRIPEMVLKPRDIPLKRMETELTKGNQAGLALTDCQVTAGRENSQREVLLG